MLNNWRNSQEKKNQKGKGVNNLAMCKSLPLALAAQLRVKIREKHKWGKVSIGNILPS